MNRKLLYVLGAVAGLAILAGSAASALAAPPAQTPAAQQQAAPGRGYGLGGPMMGGWAGPFNMPEIVAQVIKADVNDVIKDRQAGKSFVGIAQAKGVGEDALIQGILAQRKALLDEQVNAGRITAEQETFMLDRMNDSIKVMVEQTGYGPGARGGYGANAGNCPAWQGQAPSQNQSQQGVGLGARGVGRGGMMGGLGAGFNRQ
ncbi:MAG: hypothetical protein M1401_10540 [Chloroflexi bacterium]|nr:hypothetical protein [Chloroflexota bacterium]